MGSQQKPAGMIPFFDAERQSSIWKHELKQAYRSVRELLTALSLSPERVPEVVTESDFPLLVPRPFVARMTPGDPMDPLLRQVLPVSAEHQKVAGFVADPLAEHGQPTPWLHKYRSRVLLTLTGGCAVNCRYCFRRHFPYHAHRMGKMDWQQLADLLHRHPEINEIILSGGEPLLVEDAQLAEIAAWIGQQPNIKRWRIHTRMLVVIPARITSELCKILSNTKPCVVVLHINHPNEIDASLCEHLQPLRKAGVW
ncbi:MAG: KamA family radical SAM protein, partial [Gammaproteobacteria bacterium]